MGRVSGNDFDQTLVPEESPVVPDEPRMSMNSVSGVVIIRFRFTIRCRPPRNSSEHYASGDWNHDFFWRCVGGDRNIDPKKTILIRRFCLG